MSKGIDLANRVCNILPMRRSSFILVSIGFDPLLIQVWSFLIINRYQSQRSSLID